MAETLTLKLSKRGLVGKKVKQLRRGGAVPVYLYGGGHDSMPLQVESRVLHRLIPRIGMNVPVSVEIEGSEEESICFIREIQRHPVTEDLLHVDFLRVDISKTIRAEVPITLTGEAPAVANMSGTLFQTMQTATVESLPMTIPASFTVDVSDLDDFEKAVRIEDIVVSGDVALLHEANELIARVLPPRIEEEEEVEEEAIEGEMMEEEGEKSAEVEDDTGNSESTKEDS